MTAKEFVQENYPHSMVLYYIPGYFTINYTGDRQWEIVPANTAEEAWEHMRNRTEKFMIEKLGR